MTPLQVRLGHERDLLDSVTALMPADGELLVEYLVPQELDTSDW